MDFISGHRLLPNMFFFLYSFPIPCRSSPSSPLTYRTSFFSIPIFSLFSKALFINMIFEIWSISLSSLWLSLCHSHPVQVVPYTSLRLTKLAQYEGIVSFWFWSIDSLLLSENDGTVSVISLDQIETKSTSVHTYLTGCDQSINSLVYRSSIILSFHPYLFNIEKEKNLLISSSCEIAFYDL